ncbi:MAG: hypothetical protein AAGA25_14775 [Planctomycetota bacterium]
MSLSLNTNVAQNAYTNQPTLGRSEQNTTTQTTAATKTSAPKNTPASGGSVTDLFKSQFAELAGDKAAFHAMMKQSFGEGYDAATAEAFRKMALAGDFSWMPAVAYVTDEKLGGALGAYDSVNNVVYLNRTLASDPSFAASIYVEEAGHFLDTALNTTDTAGDEGELFRRLMAGEKISAADLKAINAENDFGTITINGQEIQIEQWNPFKSIKKAAKKVGSAIKKAAKKVVSAVKTVAKKVGQAIKAGVDFAVNKILTPVVKALLSTLGPLVEKLGKELAPLIAAGGKVVEILEKVFGPVMKVVNDLAGPILKPLGKILGGIEKATDAILGPFLKPLREGMSSLIGKLTKGARSAHVTQTPGTKPLSKAQRNANINKAEEQLQFSAKELLSGATIGLAIIGGVAALTGVFNKLKNYFKKFTKGKGKKSVSFDTPSKKSTKKLHKDRANFRKKQNRKVNTKNGRKPIQHQGPRKNLGDGPAKKQGVTSKRDIEAIRKKQAARRGKTYESPAQAQKNANAKARHHHNDLKAENLKARKAKTQANRARAKKEIAQNKAELKKLNREQANLISKRNKIEAQNRRTAARNKAADQARETKLANRKAHAQDMQQNWAMKSSAEKASYIKSIYGKGGYGR